MLESTADPVTGFSIPPSWIRACPDPQALEKIQSGRWVLLSNGLLLKRGLTTGTTAAAACKGAILSLKRSVHSLEVATPAGIRVTMPVMGKEGFCVAVKDGGDHQFDVTSGLEIVAQARPSEKTVFAAGRGVGRIVARGLCDEVGRPAISPSARKQIMMAIAEGLKEAGLDHACLE